MDCPHTFIPKIVQTYSGFKVSKDHITRFLYCDASGGLYGKTCTYLLFHKSSDLKREEQESLIINLHNFMFYLSLVPLIPLFP
jgi:hypothetical protein